MESYLREKQRNDHLQNLGLKRHTSFRKSLTKRLKKRKRRPSLQQQNSKDQQNEPSVTETSQIDGPSTSSNNHCDLHEPQPSFRRSSFGNIKRSNSNPTLSTSSKAGDKPKSRGMDNLRKSFRASFRKRKDKDQDKDFVRERTGGSGKSKLWQQDEIAVRAGTCSFDVKYLGCIEVFDSRGMPVCEEALKKLKNSKKKSIRSILYINGDGLRVVDFETKGLLVDQTIEKVSFCAPDHNYDRGFSYICRDGTTRRWMCHGFMAIKETGDRLSHAVGCAFAICLEKKQKRDRECAVTMNFDNSNSSFTRIGSFRQATITERLADPQGIKPSEPVPKPNVEESSSANPFAIARPHATDLMLQRQTSFREFSRLQSRTSPFKRQLSLRVSDLPSSLERKSNDASDFISGGVGNKVATKSDPFEDLCDLFKNQAFSPTTPIINSSLFTKAEITLSTVPEADDSLPSPLAASPLPPVSTASVKSEEFRSSETEAESGGFEPRLQNQSSNSFQNFHTTTSLNTSTSSGSLIKPFDSENPWDLVPDQPALIKDVAVNLNGPSATASTLPLPVAAVSNGGNFKTPSPHLVIGSNDSKNDSDSSTSPASSTITTKNIDKKENNQSLPINVMDDPFDADWVSLALKQTNNQQIL